MQTKMYIQKSADERRDGAHQRHPFTAIDTNLIAKHNLAVVENSYNEALVRDVGNLILHYGSHDYSRRFIPGR